VLFNLFRANNVLLVFFLVEIPDIEAFHTPSLQVGSKSPCESILAILPRSS
jgi:hypothetical protein